MIQIWLPDRAHFSSVNVFATEKGGILTDCMTATKLCGMLDELLKEPIFGWACTNLT